MPNINDVMRDVAERNRRAPPLTGRARDLARLLRAMLFMQDHLSPKERDQILAVLEPTAAEEFEHCCADVMTFFESDWRERWTPDEELLAAHRAKLAEYDANKAELAKMLGEVKPSQ